MRWLSMSFNKWALTPVFQGVFLDFGHLKRPVQRASSRLGWPKATTVTSALSVGLFSATIAANARPLSSPPPPQTSHLSQIEKIAVFGKDNRQVLNRQKRGVGNKVGLLYDRAARSVCSAFCVAPNVVATAAHCLSAGRGGRNARLNRFTFQLPIRGRMRQTRIAGAQRGLAALNVTTGTDHLRLRPPIDAARDWAFVRLEKNICRYGHFKLSRKKMDDVLRLARQDKIYQTAFHRDFGNWKLAIDTGCPVARSFPGTSWRTVQSDFRSASRLVLHKCDTAGASSGSPLLVDGANGPEVVAINVGTYLRAKMIMQNGRVMKKMASKTIANTGVHAAPLYARLQNFLAAPALTHKRQVEELQERLAAAGFYRGKIDGLYGARMRFAIESYERTMALPVTGLATVRLLQQFRQQDAVSEFAPTSPVKKTRTNPSVDLRKARHQRTRSATAKTLE